MQIVVISNDTLKAELVSKGTAADVDIIYAKDTADLLQYTQADAFIDLLFQNTAERIHLLQPLLPKPVIINSVLHTLQETHPSFIRINGWTTFLQSHLVEGSCTDEWKEKAAVVFTALNKKTEWLPDEPGFVTPRVVSMIINEAFFALAEGVSTQEEIDTAMKLGTAYPYGPFEWAKIIGLQNIAALLNKLSLQQKRYTPCTLLMQQMDAAT